MYRYFTVDGQRFKVDAFTKGRLVISDSYGVDLISLENLDLWKDDYEIKRAIKSQITEREI